MHTAQLEIGQRVHCVLPFAGEGIIFAIQGEQTPGGVQNHGGIAFSGGNARISVVFEQGTVSEKLPEGLLRSNVQWTVFDEKASDDDIAEALKYARQVTRKKAAAKARANQAFYAEQRALLQAPEFKKLKREGKHKHAAAANVRTLLKKAFPSVKFSVRKGASYSSLDVAWTDGPTIDQVDAVISRFKRGSFDSMDDSYTRQRSAWTTLFGGVDYLNTNRRCSDELYAKGIALLWEKYQGNLRGIEQPTPADVRAGKTFYLQIPRLGESVQTMLHRTLTHYSAI